MFNRRSDDFSATDACSAGTARIAHVLLSLPPDAKKICDALHLRHSATLWRARSTA